MALVASCGGLCEIVEDTNMLVDYRRYLQQIDYNALLIEAVGVWAIDAPEQYSAEELIEIMVGKDEALSLAGAL